MIPPEERVRCLTEQHLRGVLASLVAGVEDALQSTTTTHWNSLVSLYQILERNRLSKLEPPPAREIGRKPPRR
jgi:hypothetical protein